MEKKINLEEIRQSIFEKHQVQYDDYDMSVFDDCMLEAIKQTLQLAAENVTVEYEKDSEFGSYDTVVDKQSILDIINQVE